jgi:hypothetical protein
MDEQIFLPDSEELERILIVVADDPSLKEKLYPIIVKSLSKKALSPKEITRVVVAAAKDYLEMEDIYAHVGPWVLDTAGKILAVLIKEKQIQVDKSN